MEVDSQITREHGRGDSGDEDDGERNFAGAGGEHQPMVSHKKRRIEYTEIERRLENLIIRVGDKSTSELTTNIEALCQVLEADLVTYKERIISILVECSVDSPAKLTIYTTLVGLLNAKNHVFGGEVVEALMRRLRESLRQQAYDNALHIVLFLCDLVNCQVVSAHSCMSFLETLVGVLHEQNVPQVRRDWYAFAVLHSLPYVGCTLLQRKPAELDRCLDHIQVYLTGRQRLHVNMLRVWASAKPLPQSDYLDSLWTQISGMRASGWRDDGTLVPRHYLAFSDRLAEALQHNLPTFMPPPHQTHSSYPLPSVVFRLFDLSDCPEDGPKLPEASSMQRFVIERDLSFIIDQYYLERKDCASALLAYKHATPIPLNYMILEVVFGSLFELPRPKYLELFYGALLIELCKLQPDSMPQVLAQAAELLYQRVDSMQPACFDRFVNWFSYHLSNFQFRWSWEDWMDCLQGTPESPRQMFVRECLQKVLRFTYYQRVIDIVPAGFAPLLPSKPTPNYRYAVTNEGSESLPGADIAARLTSAIRSKCTCNDVLDILRECTNPDEMSPFNALAVEVFVLTLLNLGSKTFSHSFAALTKYHATLKTLTDNNEEAQMCVLRCVYELWSSHTQKICVLVDKLLKMQIVDCSVIVTWVFSPEMKDEFIRMWVWEMLESALLKLAKHVDQLRTEEKHAQRAGSQSKFFQQSTDETNEEDEKEKAALTEKLNAAEAVQKDLLLTLFQNFTILLTEHLLTSESEGVQFDTPWYVWVIGRLRHMFLVQHTEAAAQTENLETYLFTNDIDLHILEVFHQFCALRR